MKDFLLKTKFISALMIVVNLHFFNSIHCCFVSIVLNVIVFVYNGLKQSLIQQAKPNRLLQISFFHRILRVFLKNGILCCMWRLG